MQVDLPEQRRRRLLHECGRAGIHALLVYGNAWTCDFLRDACDFVPLEGHGAAVLTADGTRLILEQRGEADRARAEVPGLAVRPGGIPKSLSIRPSAEASAVFAEAGRQDLERLLGGAQ